MYDNSRMLLETKVTPTKLTKVYGFVDFVQKLCQIFRSIQDKIATRPDN